MTGSKPWIRDYGSETTVHGVKYVTWSRPNHPCCIRLIWACVIIASFLAVGYLIRQAFMDWEAHQVITTLDSVAAPFTEIQFPTVTVCPDDQTMPDGWSLVTHLMNFWKFECYPDNPNNKTYPDCAETMLLRSDFAGFLNMTVKELTAKLKEVDQMETVGFGGFDVMELLNDAMTQPMGSTAFGDFTYTAHQICLGQFYGERAIQFIKAKLKEFNTGVTLIQSIEDCENDTLGTGCPGFLDGVLTFIGATGFVVPYGPVLPFGALLRTFARLESKLLSPLPYKFEGEDFNGVKDFEGYTEYEYETTYNNDFDCTKLDVGFLRIHQLAMTLAKGMGIPNASLLDLPQLIGSQGIKELSRPEPTFFKFPFTFCQNSLDGMKSVDECMLLWKSFMEKPWNMSHPCDSDLECCHKYASPDVIGTNLTAIMITMKHAYHTSQSNLKLEALRNLIDDETNPYPVTSEDQGYYSGETIDNVNSITPHCKLGNRVSVSGVLFKPKCEDFKPVITNRGICYAYNAEPFTKFAVESPFTETFSQAYKEELGEDTEVHNNLGSGKSFGLEFWLDSQAIPFKQTGTRNSFIVGISDKRGYLEMQVSGQQINLGTKTVMEVSAEATESSEELRVVDIAHRKCRFEDELSNSSSGLFKVYTQTSCQFECMLDYSAKACRCIPWNFPPIEGINQTCDAISNYCFAVHMKNVSQLANCDCPMDCNKLSYSYKLTENSVEGDLEAYCEGKGAGMQYTKMKLNEYPRPFQGYDTFFTNMSYTPRPITLDRKLFEPQVCKEMMRNSIADVAVMWTKPYYIKYRQDKRVTFVDQISSLGGTLGLFTGMSFLSMFELVYWIYSGFMGALKPKGKKKGEGQKILY